MSDLENTGNREINCKVILPTCTAVPVHVSKAFRFEKSNLYALLQEGVNGFYRIMNKGLKNYRIRERS